MDFFAVYAVILFIAGTAPIITGGAKRRSCGAIGLMIAICLLCI